MRYRKWEDRQRCLIGKILLSKGLYALGYFSLLQDIQYTEFNRPYVSDTLDFNISHAGAFTLCAISETTSVGIDIEQIHPFLFQEYESCFSAQEWKRITQAENRLVAFFKLWTQKEAFLKAAGCGLNLSPAGIRIKNNKVTTEDQEWFLHEIRLNKEYPCHLCTSAVQPSITINEVQLLKAGTGI